MKLLLLISLVFPTMVGYSQFLDNAAFKGCNCTDSVENTLKQKKWAVKFTPTALIVGELGLGVEKAVGKLSSVQFDIGATVSNIGIGGIEVRALKSDIVSLDSRMGWFARGMYRFYPNAGKIAMRGLYVGGAFKYRLYRTMMRDDFEGNEIISRNDQFRFSTIVGINLWTSRNFVFDLHAGAGMGYRDVQVFDPITTFSNSSWNFRWVDNGLEDFYLALDVGLSIGIGK